MMMLGNLNASSSSGGQSHYDELALCWQLPLTWLG